METQIPYANYRGAAMDGHGPSWLGLDSSIKAAGYTFNTPLDFPQDVDLPTVADEYLQTYRDETPLDFLQTQVQTALADSGEYTAVLSSRELNEEILNIVPSSLQFRQIAVTGEYADLPSDLVHQARFVAKGPEGEELFDVTLNVHALSNQQVLMEHEPETVEDQEIINSYGGLGNTPAYMVNLRPVLKVGGESMAVARDGYPVGEDYSLDITFISPNGEIAVSNAMVNGARAYLGVFSQKAESLKTVADEDKNAARILQEVAVSYVDQWNQAEDELASLLRLCISRPVPTLVVVGSMVNVTDLLGAPHGFDWKGVYVDADLRCTSVSPAAAGDDSGQAITAFMYYSSMQGSILEDVVLTEAFDVPAMSTARLLGLASSLQIPLLTINADNEDDLISTLPFSDEVIADIRNAVNQGYEVVVPEQEMAADDWTGVGYLKTDPQTGESGWMLSGMIAGANTIILPSYTPVESMSGEAVQDDPSKASHIQKILDTDGNFGVVNQVLESNPQVKVTDDEGNAVSGADVTFEVPPYHGSLFAPGSDGEGEGASQTTVKTDDNGYAEVLWKMSTSTSDNPVYGISKGDQYYTQYGHHLLYASLESGESVSPFQAWAAPDEAAQMEIVQPTGDDRNYHIYTWAGPLQVLIKDQYGNFVSNEPVTFTALERTKRCDYYRGDITKAELVDAYAPCLDNNIPSYGDCSGQQERIVNSDIGAAAVQVFVGDYWEATYPVRVACMDFSETIDFKTHDHGACIFFDEDTYTTGPGTINLGIETRSYVDKFGNIINAIPIPPPPKAGDEPVEATTDIMLKHYCIIEEIQHNWGMCWPLKRYSIFPISHYAIPPDNGIEEGGYKIFVNDKQIPSELIDEDAYIINYRYSMGFTPKKHVIDFYSGAVKRLCFLGCGHYDDTGYCYRTYARSDYTVSTTRWLVDVKWEEAVKENVYFLVDEDGYVLEDTPITYTILPEDYTALSAQINVYEDGHLYTYGNCSASGENHVTLAKGTRFNLEKEYTAEIVLNAGTGNEIKSLSTNLVPVHRSFQDKVPQYALADVPDGRGECDNYFLRENSDHQDLDIYYKILPEGLPVSRAKIKIYTGMDGRPETIECPKDNGGFLTGKNLHVTWTPPLPQDTSSTDNPGFYRIQLEVQVDGGAAFPPTDIKDGDEDVRGWQCPQECLAVHDLFWKHRLIVHMDPRDIGQPTNIAEFHNFSNSGNFEVSSDEKSVELIDPDNSEPIVRRWWGTGIRVPVSQRPDYPNSSLPFQEFDFLDLFDDNEVSRGEWDKYPKWQIGVFKTNPGSQTIYHSVNRTDSQDFLFLQFWMFENFSTGAHNIPGKKINELYGPEVEHEGDMEHCHIAIRYKHPNNFAEKSNWLVSYSATASQHYYAQTLPWYRNVGTPSLEAWQQKFVEHGAWNGNSVSIPEIVAHDYNDQRLVVFIAMGAHATYFAADLLIDVDEFTKLGTECQYNYNAFLAYDKTCRNPIKYSLSPLSGNEWLDTFLGRWGYVKRRYTLPWTAFTFGPPGPSGRYAGGKDGERVYLRGNPVQLHNQSLAEALQQWKIEK